MRNKVLTIGLIAAIAVSAVTIGLAYSGNAPNILLESGATLENVNIEGDDADMAFGGSTSANWSVGGNLSVTGSSAFTGEVETQRLVQGGSILSASTSATVNDTLTAAEVCNYSSIVYNKNALTSDNGEAITVTLPATSTLFADCLDTDGDHISFWFINASPTAATTTTIAAGTGMDLLEPDESNDFNVVIGGGGKAKIEIWRCDYCNGNLDAYVTVTEYSAAD